MLKLGRRLAEISNLQAEQIDGVAEPDRRAEFLEDWEFEVGINVNPAVVVVKLEIGDQRHSWPNLLEMKNLAPAVMTEDDVRCVPTSARVVTTFGDRPRSCPAASLKMSGVDPTIGLYSILPDDRNVIGAGCTRT